MTAAPLRVAAHAESWPLGGAFTIARGTKTQADVVVVTVSDGRWSGRGECVPYPRYGETIQGVLDAIGALAAHWAGSVPRPLGRHRQELLAQLPAGAARNAVDCALWDLEVKQSGRPAWELAGLPKPQPVATAYTVGLGSAAAMAQAARRHAWRRLIKVKLGGAAREDIERLAAVRRAAPGPELIVDVNEGWSMRTLRAVAPAAADLGVALIEQPLPAPADDALAGYQSPVPLGADESCHGGFGAAPPPRPPAGGAAGQGAAADPALAAAALTRLARKYAVVNIKLDKSGGLTGALALAARAGGCGLDVMIGCMVATSLATAPALLLARDARFVDLDGPLLLAEDRADGLSHVGDTVAFPPRGGWGLPA